MAWSLGGVIREQARRRGDRPMITYGTRTITWSEMDTRASRVGQALLGAGLTEQSRVAFLDKNGPEYFEVLLGGGKVNVVNVAVNWRLAPRRDGLHHQRRRAPGSSSSGQDFVPPRRRRSSRPSRRYDDRRDRRPPRHEDYEAWVARHPAVDPGSAAAPTTSPAALHVGHDRAAQGRDAHQRQLLRG